MLVGAVTPVEHPVWIARLSVVASDHDGILHPLVVPKAYVQKGMKIGYVTNYFSQAIAEVDRDAREPAPGNRTKLAFPEMIPATRGERRAIQFDGRGATADGAGSGERQTFEFGRDLNARRRGEEQLVVLAAIQGLAESGAGVDGRGGDFGFDARGAAEAMEVERKAVAQIHGGGRAQAAQEAAERQTRFGTQVAAPGAAGAALETQGRAA